MKSQQTTDEAEKCRFHFNKVFKVVYKTKHEIQSDQNMMSDKLKFLLQIAITYAFSIKFFKIIALTERM